MDNGITIIASHAQLERQFEFVNSLIERHRSSAIKAVNTEALLMNWEIGQFISVQLKSAQWGAKVVSELADYLKRQNPGRRGFGKRNLYNMVKLYEMYSRPSFIDRVSQLNVGEFVQLPSAQLETADNQPLPLLYTLSRSLSPTMIAEYQRKLIPQDVMRKSLEEYCAFLKNNK